MTFIWDELNNILFVDSISWSGYYPGTIAHTSKGWRSTMFHYHMLSRVLKDDSTATTFSSVRLRR